jgi:two-component system, OmpR family, alkaline phosphatase synthesis response regulator PhoP
MEMPASEQHDQPLVLVVDDEQSLLDAISYSLRREGWSVETASDGPSAVELNRTLRPDLIVLDVMLPGMDGLQVCRSVRQESDVPVLFLSARGEDVDRILGLEIGGDDYLTKPFIMRELVARVRANLRRSAAVRSGQPDGSRRPPAGEDGLLSPEATHAGKSQIAIGHVLLDLAGRRVTINGRAVPLKPKEFELISYLARRPDVAVSRETLLRDVWKYSYSVDTRTVDVHIRGLRQKLERDPSHPQLIETVRGHGYRLKVA